MLLETLGVYRYHRNNILKTLRQFLSETAIMFRSPLNIREIYDTSESKVKFHEIRQGIDSNTYFNSCKILVYYLSSSDKISTSGTITYQS